MEFIWSVSDESSIAHKNFWKNIQEIFKEDEGLCYYKYPIYSFNGGRQEHDFLILHRELGLFVVGLRNYVIDELEEISEKLWKISNRIIKEDPILMELEDKMFLLHGKFITNSALRKENNLLIPTNTILVLPLISKKEWNLKKFKISKDVEDKIFFSEDLELNNLKIKCRKLVPLQQLNILTENQWTIAQGILKGVPVIQKKVRRKIDKTESMSNMLHEVENQLISIDRNQHKLSIQIPNGPQRIRGLAGSGKTIILCMKAAWMHLRYPNWKIVYTFYTRSLYGMIKKLITRFYRYWNDEDPNWENIQILHGWGGSVTAGVYSNVCKALGEKSKTYYEAINLFKYKETNELLGQCCRELLYLHKDLPTLYDAILIDEAQDFHFEFYKLCLNILREPKRLIWVYDDVQSLESLSVPTTEDIFGLNDDGSLLVDLEGFYEPGNIEKDVILYRCYRTPRPILVAAHIFGMGLLREEGPIQFIPSQGGWEDIGYEIIDGSFLTNSKVTLRRPKENSPHILEDLVGYKNLINFQEFSNRTEEIHWVSNKIAQLIKREGIKPEEILVISMDWRNMKYDFQRLQYLLEEQEINSIIPGTDTESNIFQTLEHVTLAGVFRAKGNEASVVFVVAFDEVHNNPNLVVQERNQVFTALTRTRGWSYLSGIDSDCSKLFSEINQILDNEEITFIVPDMKLIQRNLDNLEYERKRKNRTKLKKLMKQVENLLIEIDDPKLKTEVIEQLQKEKEFSD